MGKTPINLTLFSAELKIGCAHQLLPLKWLLFAREEIILTCDFDEAKCLTTDGLTDLEFNQLTKVIRVGLCSHYSPIPPIPSLVVITYTPQSL